ncbi:MAG: M48 family metalloprotease [Treponema sp.]|nr:M48 family metalloprotease [Treponema sp.]
MRNRTYGSCLRTLALAAAASTALASCASIVEKTSGFAVASGLMTQDQAASSAKLAQAVDKTFEDITPEQEYYIGRSVGAQVLSTSRPYSNAAASRYVNLLGQSLALFSTRPETFGGYHFQVLDSDAINAFAAPGGHIFVTRGMLRLCSTEHELAAVLAHEIAHVQFQHGLKAIKASRLSSVFTIIGTEAAKNLSPGKLQEVTAQFADSITDITSSLINSGYSQATEFEADKGAVAILQNAGYNPAALVSMLAAMKTRLKPGAPDFAKTHPEPETRIDRIRRQLGTLAPVVESPQSRERRTRALAGV